MSIVSDAEENEDLRDANPPPVLPQQVDDGAMQNSIVSDLDIAEENDEFANEDFAVSLPPRDDVSDLGGQDVKDLSGPIAFRDDSSSRAAGAEIFSNEPPTTPNRVERAPESAVNRFSRFGDSLAKALKLADEISV